MATAAAEIDFIPDEVEFLPDDPIDFIPDAPDAAPSSAPIAAPVPQSVIDQEARRATAGALQAADLAALPSRLDWTEARLAQSDQLWQQAAQINEATPFFETNAAKNQREASANALVQQAESIRRQIRAEPASSGAAILRERDAQFNASQYDPRVINPLGRMAEEVIGGPLGSKISGLTGSPIGVNFQANIVPAATGALGAAAMTIPGGQGLGASSLATVLTPIAGGIGGSMLGGAGQEVALMATETDEETQERRGALEQVQQENPIQSIIGTAGASSPFLAPSLSQFRNAMAGNRYAQQAIGASAAIGGGISGINDLIAGRHVSLANAAQAALENVIFNKPTRLGRAIGLPVDPTTERVPDAPEVVAPPAMEDGPPITEDTGFPPIEVGGESAIPEPPATSTPEPPPEAIINTPEPPAATTPEPVEPSVDDIVPAIRVEGQVVRGNPGETHQQIFDRATADMDEVRKIDAVADFDSKSNPNVFLTPDGTELSRKQLQDQFGVRDSQGLAELQAASKLARTPTPTSSEPIPGVDPTPTPSQPPPSEPPPATPEGAQPAPAADQNVTALKNARVDQERAQRGLPPMADTVPVADQAIWDRAGQAIEQDPNLPDRLVAELTESPRPTTPEETMVLLRKRVELRSEYQRAAQRVVDANQAQDADALQAAEADMRIYSQRLSELDAAHGRGGAGTEAGRAFRLRRLFAAEDYSLAGMLAERSAARGGEPLTAKEIEEVTKQSEQLKANEEAFQKREEAADTEASGKAVDETIKSAISESDPQTVTLVERINKYLDARASKARQRLSEKFGKITKLGAKPDPAMYDPTILVDVIDLAVSSIAKKTVNFASWSSDMLKEFGEGIRGYLQPAWEKAEGGVDKAVDAVASGKTREAAKRAIKSADPAAMTAGIKAAADEGAGAKELRSKIQNLAKAFVKSGVTERDPLIDAVHAAIEPALPGMSRREVMDLISGYGDYRPLSKDQVDAQVRDLKGQMQQVAKLEDIRAGEPLERTGVERRTPSAEERRLIKEVNEAKRKHGVVITDPETQLKSAMDGMKTRLRNQIQDLSHQIETGKKSETKTPMERDQEIQILEGMRDRARETLREIEGPTPISDEQKLATAQRSVESQIAAYEQRIKNRELETPTGKKGPTSPELEALKSRRDALKAELQELRDLDSTFQENRQSEALVRRIEAAERQLAGTAKPVKGKSQGAESELVADAKKQLADLKDQIKAKRAPEVLKQKQAKAEESLEKAIEELDQKLQAGNLGPRPPKPGTPKTARMEELQSQLDAMRQLRDELRNATLPRLTPEERAMRAYKSRVARQNADLQERIATGDFTTRKRTPLDLSKDPEAVRLRGENEKIKQEFQSAKAKDEYRRMTAAQKAWEATKATVDASTNLRSSFDLSAPRQAAIMFMSRPLMSIKQIPKMIHAFASEKEAARQFHQLMLRPNAVNGVYDQAKLAITPYEGGSFSSKEESMGSWLAEKIPGVRMSNRAFQSLLNNVRANAFDSMAAMNGGNPLTPEQARELGSFVNIATGRGDSKFLAKNMGLLGRVLWSPRLLLSRIQWLTGTPMIRAVAKGDPFMRKVVAKEYARWMAGVAAIYGIAELAEETLGKDKIRVGKDPRSSDFGKIITDNQTRHDPMGGLAQVMTLAGRLTTGETVSTKGGRAKSLTDKRSTYSTDVGDVMTRFARSKLSPPMATLTDIVTRKQFGGEPTTPESVAKNTLMPLSFAEVPEEVKVLGAQQALSNWLFNAFGVSTRTYDPRFDAPNR